ncbi:MAG: RND family transporter [Thermoplasmata archaeon]|nr:MAG: RND family transporter [Thermoplasmata archaeon]
MLEGLAGKVQTYAVQIIVVVIVITILFSGVLPSIKVLTNWEEFYPDNEVVRDFNKVNNNFGWASKYHYVYVENKDGGDVLSPASLREQYNLTREVEENVTGVEDVVSVAEFINLGINFYNDTKDILNATDGEIEILKQVAVSIYQANFTGELPIDIDIEEVQMLMATLLPADFNPDDPKANATLIVVMIYGLYDEPQYKKKSLNVRDVVNGMDFNHIKVEQTSNALLTHDVDQSVWDTTITLGLAIFILIVVLLAVSFRDYTYVLLPVFTLIIVAIWTFGTMVIMGVKFTVVEVAVLPLVVGLGIDYSVHISRRYQEELKKGADVSLALKRSVKMVGSALSLAVATTIIAFFSNVFSEITPIRNFGILVGLGIFYAFFLTLTFQCAARYLLDSRKGAKVLGKTKKDPKVLDKGMTFGAHTVKRHPAPVIVIVLIITFLALFYSIGVETEFSLEDFVPSDWPTMRTTELIRDHFASASYTQEYILMEGDISNPDVIDNIALMEDNIADDTHVVSVELAGKEIVRVESVRKFMAEAIMNNQSLEDAFNLTVQGLPTENCTENDIQGIFSYLCTNVSYQDKVKSVLFSDAEEERFAGTIIRVFVSAEGTSEARRVYTQLKDDIVNTDGVEEKVTGETVLVITTIDSFQRSQIVTTAFSVILSAIVLMLVYRNFLLGVIAVVPVAISTIWILGTMALLGISINVFTVMVTALTIGLGIDYSIHIIQRFREERKTQGPKESMQTTIERTGSAIFISALTTICGFAVLLLSPMPLTQHFGIITAATIVYSFDLAVFVLPILLLAWALHHEKMNK